MHDLYPPKQSTQQPVPVDGNGRPRPMTWREVMDLLEDVDVRLRGLLDSNRRISVPVRHELATVVALIDPALVREGRRPSPGEGS